MKISKAIVSTTNNSLYTECLPLVTRGWKNLENIETIIAAVGDCYLDRSLGRVLDFELIEGIPSSFISQVIRFIVPAFFPDEICIISDVDMLPLSKKYFIDSLKKYDEESILVLTSDAYGVDYKFPMCYTVAKGRNFQKLIGLSDLTKESIISFIVQLYEMNHGWDTDELYLGQCIKIKKNELDIRFLERVKNFPFKRTRIDRSNWKINIFKFFTKQYIDSHLLRPINSHKKQLELLELYVYYDNNIFKAIIKKYLNKLNKTQKFKFISLDNFT